MPVTILIFFYYCRITTMSDDKIKSFLSDLGRATLRGVRRCPKCGTYNGTRGLCCKKCNCLFKEKRKFSTEVCKLVTGNSTQIYSVRVHDKGPDYRGFVQLPFMQSKILSQDTDNFVLSETALCFVDSCQRLFDTSILKCHETDPCLVTPMCQHIEAAVKCSNEATILDLKESVLSLLNVSNDIKQEIFQLVSQSTAPLVQRVSKNVMAVKCLVSPKHPLGYLHFSFFTPKMKEKPEDKFYCSCADFIKGIHILLRKLFVL